MARTQSPSESQHSHIVLVVEDDDVLRHILLDYLNDAGFVVFEAANADEARDIVDRSGVVELVVTDINMPGSMNGGGAGSLAFESSPKNAGYFDVRPGVQPNIGGSASPFH